MVMRRVPKDPKSGVPKKYLSGAKNKRKKAAEIKRTAQAYKEGRSIDVKAVSKSRTEQANGKSKTTKRKRKKTA
jgi:hypothetical protein